MSTAVQRRDARVARRRARRAGLVVPGPTRIVEPPQYLPVCIACGKQDSCPLWKGLSKCGRVKALDGDPAYPCPEGKFGPSLVEANRKN